MKFSKVWMLLYAEPRNVPGKWRSGRAHPWRFTGTERSKSSRGHAAGNRNQTDFGAGSSQISKTAFSLPRPTARSVDLPVTGRVYRPMNGITGAPPVWVEIMNWLHRDGSSREPEAPPGVVCRDVEFSHSGRSRRECFIAGTETPVVQETAASVRTKIVYPASGTVIALDPDIPAAQQRLFLEAEPRDDRLRWVLDDEVLGSAGSLVLWIPKVGPHTLALSDETGRVLDSVVFQVRGRVNQLASK
jgi:hypothetical protein